MRRARSAHERISLKKHMNRITLAAAAAAAVLAVNSTEAAAQTVRTFVSGHGADTGTCGVGAPCRTFAYALTQTAAKGEIVVLDSAGYGIVTITQAVSITDEQGAEAAVTVSAGDGITVNVGASDIVNLTGLTLIGNGGANGIAFHTGGTLTIQNCVARGFTSNGISLAPTAVSAVSVMDTVVAGNGLNGIDYFPLMGGSAFFKRVGALGNSNIGIAVDVANSTVVATVRDSDATGSNWGFFVEAGVSTMATVTLINDTAFNNNVGVEAGFATMILAQTTLTNNGTGYVVGDSAVIKSFGDNHIADTSNTGSLTMVALQ
jgi:hypothetical protein